jgi:hypothetical protein
LYLERTKDYGGSSTTAWCAKYEHGEFPAQEVVVEGVKGVKYAPKPPGMYKFGEKMGGFPHFFN